MKDLIDYYESILDTKDNLDGMIKDVEEFDGYSVISKLLGTTSLKSSTSYNKKKRLIKMGGGYCMHISLYDNVPCIFVPAKGPDLSSNYWPVKEFQEYNISIDVDLFVDYDVIKNGFTLSQLNFSGKNRNIIIKDIKYNQSKEGYGLIKKFFDILPDPSNVLHITWTPTWVEDFLKDSLSGKFAAIQVSSSFGCPVDLDDIKNCQANVLMVNNCKNWADPNNSKIKTYKEYFSLNSRTKPVYYKTKPQDNKYYKKDNEPEAVFTRFLQDNPKTKLVVNMYYSQSWEYIQLKNNKIVSDIIKDKHFPWKKL